MLRMGLVWKGGNLENAPEAPLIRGVGGFASVHVLPLVLGCHRLMEQTFRAA